MKNVIRMACVGVLALGASVWADTVEPSQRVQWLTSVTEGYYNDPANWTGGLVPSNGIDGLYGYVNFQANDVTIKAPPGGLEDDSGSIFLGTGAGTHTLTIDTRGSFWEKKNLKSVNDWWGSPFAQNLTGTHIFNFEGLVRNGVTPAVWRFEDALFTWKSTGTSQQDFDLWSGKFSLSSQLYLGSAGGNVNFYIHPEATLESTGWFYQRGNATTHTWFLGGNHSFLSLALKDANSSSGTTWMHITNDAVVTVRSEAYLGHQSTQNGAARSRGILDVSCSGRFVVNALNLGGGTITTNRFNRGDLILRDSASLSAGAVYVGARACATGVLEVADHAVAETSGDLRLCLYSNSWGRVTLSGNSSTTIGGVTAIANQSGQGCEPVGTGLIWGTRTQGRCGAVVESVCGQLAVPGVAFQPRFHRAVHGGRPLARDGQSGVVRGNGLRVRRGS